MNFGPDIDELITLNTINPVFIHNDMFINNMEDSIIHDGHFIGIEAVVETAGILEFRVNIINLQHY